jgi:tetratricopeptide (TPR) repeat protein
MRIGTRGASVNVSRLRSATGWNSLLCVFDRQALADTIATIRKLAAARLFRDARGLARTAASELAEPALKEGGPELKLRADFATALAEVGEGRWARIHLDRAIRHAERASAPGGGELAGLLVQQARVSSQVVYYPELEPLLKRAVSVREKTLGADHPETGLALLAWAELILAHWHAYLARPPARRARAILEPVQGALAPPVLRCREILLLAARERTPAAQLASDLAGLLELRERVQGREHPDVLGLLEPLIELDPELETAVQHHGRARAALVKARGPDDPRVAYVDVLLAERWLRAHETERAVALIESALTALEAAWAADHPERMPAFGKLTMLMVWAEQGPETDAARARLKALKDLSSR